MNSSVEPEEGNKVRVRVQVAADEFESAVDDAFRKIAREVRIPGFRPGKAPRRVLEARLGRDVARGQALQDAIPDYYVAAVREHKVDVIAAPEIDITGGEEDGDVTFDAVVEVRPEVSVGGYDSLRVTVPAVEPTDEEIDEQVERIRRSHASFEPVDEAAAEGDVVVIDIAGELDGEPAPGLTAEEYSYEVGSGGITAEVDEQLTGASAGDDLSFESAHPVREDATLSFEIAVREVRRRVLPDLDDDFAAEASEFATMDELRSDLRTRAQAVRRSQVAAAMRERTGEAIAALVTDDIPEALVESEMQQRLGDLSMGLQAQGMDLGTWLAMQGRDPQEFLGQLRGSAESSARLDLALRAVVAAEAIEVGDSDLQAEWESVAQRVGATPEEVAERFESGDQVDDVRMDLAKRKAFDWIVERVEVVDEDGNPVDRTALEEPEPDTVSPGDDAPAGDKDPDGDKGPDGDKDPDDGKNDESKEVDE